MWCGECSTSHPTILFHVKQKEGFETEGLSEAEQERVQRAWGKKHRSPDEYLVGRDGHHLLVPFECDLCIFRKLRLCEKFVQKKISFYWHVSVEYPWTPFGVEQHPWCWETGIR
jgi:hypothetical protein